MPSPFPGMDPFLESPSVWGEFHHEFASALRHDLLPHLPPRYFVRVKHRKVMETLSPEELGAVIPDAAVLARTDAERRANPPAPGSALLTSPVHVELELNLPDKQFYVEVVTVERERLIAALEILSPSNKRPGTRDRARYLRMREEYLASDCHFIEIDFLRGGERWRAGTGLERTYRILLHRAASRLHAEVWPVGLRDPLPVIPVPLLPGDPEVALPLARVFASAYEGAGFERFVRYGEPVPGPALAGDELAWVRERLRSLSTSR